MRNRPFSLTLIQWIIWIFLFGVNLLSLLQHDPFTEALVYSVLVIGSFLVIVYTNAGLLLPRLYEKGHVAEYVAAVIFFLPIVSFLRYYGGNFIYNHFFAEKYEPFKWSNGFTTLISIIFVYISSILFYIALNFFKLKRKQEQLQKRQAEVELDLLKAQVQPHFLFNTLNNIYFVAQRESPATAILLEQLSSIMRYFVDEAPKDRISLTSELTFIKNYIELEKMRMRYPLTVTIKEEGITDRVTVPPMLLIPLVENVFKHGIDKLRNDNFIYLSLSIEHNRLQVTVENRLTGSPAAHASGTGLNNLKNRLTLLFGEHCMLQSGEAGHIFHAQLNIPL